MKWIKYFAFATLVFSVWSCTKKEIERFPQEALDTKIFDSNNNESTVGEVLEQYKGKQTIVKMWAGWCGDCIKSMPDFAKFQEENPDVNYVLFSVDHSESTWQGAIEKYNIQGNHFRLDGDKKWKNSPFAKAVSLTWIPRYIILDEDGNIASKKHIIEITDPKVKELIKN